MNIKQAKIGQLLLKGGYITPEMLQEALYYQGTCGCNITEYLVAQGYLCEADLAKCVTAQFNIPYLPLDSYDIPNYMIEMVPADMVKKYCLLPVDKIDNILTIVMADPLDVEAILEVEEITGCKVRQFVGLLSDIRKAIERYYRILPHDISALRQSQGLSAKKPNSYNGTERRKSMRLKSNIILNFPYKGLYQRAVTEDVSTKGIMFLSYDKITIGSYMIVSAELPKDFYSLPIAIVAQVARLDPVNKKYAVGLSFVKIEWEDLMNLIRYARANPTTPASAKTPAAPGSQKAA